MLIESCVLSFNEVARLESCQNQDNYGWKNKEIKKKQGILNLFRLSPKKS